MSEHQEQVALFQWAELQKCTVPELGLLFAIPNGGQRDAKTGAKLKREGVKRGVPDIFLPVPRWLYHGLFIEMKFGKNKATKEQREWGDKLQDQRYAWVECYGFDAAKNVIEIYLDLDETETQQ